MPEKKIRFATIGTWGHLGEPLAELATNPDVELVAHARALPDDDLPHLRKMTGNDSIPWFEDYPTMLQQVRPDVVAISTRIDQINPIAMAVANAGCHLICEKPIAIDHDSLNRLFDTCVSNKVQCISMLGNGRHPVMQAAIGATQSGRIGNVVLVNARKSYKWGNRPAWFGDRKIYGGTLCWIAVHAMEMIHLLSRQEFVSVTAMQSNLTHLDRPDCEDNGVILLQLSGGGHASISFDYLRPDAATTHGDDWVRVVGSTGTIKAGLDRKLCTLLTADAPQLDLTLPPKGAFYSPFVQALNETSEYQPSTVMRRSFMLNHVCLCARDAADQNTVIKIPTAPWNALS